MSDMNGMTDDAVLHLARERLDWTFGDWPDVVKALLVGMERLELARQGAREEGFQEGRAFAEVRR